MTPLKKKFARPYARELLQIADGDLRTAKVLLEHAGGRPENLFFLIQQAVEKALKALLCHSDLAVPLTHDLGALIAMLPDSLSGPPDQSVLLGLSEFASIRRYEEGTYEYTRAEMEAAYAAAERVLKWVGGKITAGSV